MSSFIEHYIGFLAGVASGVTKLAVGHPFDTVKVRMQIEGSKGRFKGPLNCLLVTIRKESVFALYKGATPPLVGWALMDSVQMGTLTNARLLLQGGKDEPLTLGQHAAAGLAAGIVVSFVATPVEQLKARMQVQYDASTRLYTGPIDCARKLVQNNGISGLFKGLSGCLLFRSFFWVLWGSYDIYVKQLKKWGVSQEWVPFFAGGLAANTFWTISFPADVIKNRMMTAPDVKPPMFPTSPNAIVPFAQPLSDSKEIKVFNPETDSKKTEGVTTPQSDVVAPNPLAVEPQSPNQPEQQKVQTIQQEVPAGQDPPGEGEKRESVAGEGGSVRRSTTTHKNRDSTVAPSGRTSVKNPSNVSEKDVEAAGLTYGGWGSTRASFDMTRVLADMDAEGAAKLGRGGVRGSISTTGILGQLDAEAAGSRVSGVNPTGVLAQLDVEADRDTQTGRKKFNGDVGGLTVAAPRDRKMRASFDMSRVLEEMDAEAAGATLQLMDENEKAIISVTGALAELDMDASSNTHKGAGILAELDREAAATKSQAPTQPDLSCN
ncbi:hypothetical protein HK102_004255 [Quaeritorhiza haematococci]|nr:hypothetical protein HK102_004255 [Quaeritorhiza haematococci]